MKLGINGCLGRMGQRIHALAKEDSSFEITSLLEYAEHPQASEQTNNKFSTNTDQLQNCEVVIEFTLPQGTLTNLAKCVEYKVPMVIGTTGFDDSGIQQIHAAAKIIPIVFSTNMSIGVNILFKLTEIAASITKDQFKMNLVEGHHVHKKDAPSGTAKTMIEYAEKMSGTKMNDVKSIREGEIIGDHDLVFENDEEILKVGHHAKNRDIFAKGSLVAAKFVVQQSPGLYHMQDVLGLNKIKV